MTDKVDRCNTIASNAHTTLSGIETLPEAQEEPVKTNLIFLCYC